MAKRLFLLDGMALIYRAHFAFIHRPIISSTGVNTSALYGFTNTLLDIIDNQKPTHIAVAFDTSAPTERHVEYPEYKAQREEMPEDLSAAIPHVQRMIEAFNIPVIMMDGYEADDVIGTLVKRAEKEGFETYMVTPDKDFGQLVSEKSFLYRPGRKGSEVEILGVPEVLEKWGITRIDQVIEIQGLQGDSVDNIPGIPGIGPKTAQKLIAEFDTIEGLLANAEKLKGKQKERVEEFGEQALLSRKLARINIEVPVTIEFSKLELEEPNESELKDLCVEFEFNSIGRRLFGEDFKAGRGASSTDTGLAKRPAKVEASEDKAPEVAANLKTIKDVKHDYRVITTAKERRQLATELSGLKSFCFDAETTGLDARTAIVIGLAFSWKAHAGCYVQLTARRFEEDSLFAQMDTDAMREEVLAALGDFRDVLADESIEKVGHNLKYDLSVLGWHGIEVKGKLFDTMLAHSLVEPEQRHNMDYLSEVYLGYTPVSIKALIGEKKGAQENMANVPLEKLGEYAAEDADVTWQLRERLEPLLKERQQERLFYEIESPLLPVLVDMEHEGVRIDVGALAEFSVELQKQMTRLESRVHELAGTPFNLNSPKQLGEVLFDKMQLVKKPKKTKTGQYATDEQTLTNLATEHEIVRALLEFRTAAKLKSTYADSLPQTVFKPTGRVHTTYNQAVTTTGRLASLNPNLQNIPIRTEMGREIRKAFVPRDEKHVLLSADYSQIELRIIASVSRDKGMLEAFSNGEDIHAATAAKVFGVPLKEVDSDQRRMAKMVNFGLAYGMSTFGLSQRLGIGRGEAAGILEEYFRQFPGMQGYMDKTVEFARANGYVETLTGRRRYLRDITSANHTVRSQAERNAINMPIQGTAADMIKIAMSRIHAALVEQGLNTKMILQVHDELVFDVPEEEEEKVRALIEDRMKNAIPMDVPIEVEIGTGQTWLEAH